MTDAPDIITLVDLRRLDAKFDRVIDEQQDQALRLGLTEA